MEQVHPELIETKVATLERVEGNMVEVRFRPEVKLDVEGMTELVLAKRSLCAIEPIDVLAVLPAELDFELNVLQVDHHAINGGCGLARRLALVANSPFNQRLANIYFNHHPREHATAVFLDEGDARQWLVNMMPQPSLS